MLTEQYVIRQCKHTRSGVQTCKSYNPTESLMTFKNIKEIGKGSDNCSGTLQRNITLISNITKVVLCFFMHLHMLTHVFVVFFLLQYS